MFRCFAVSLFPHHESLLDFPVSGVHFLRSPGLFFPGFIIFVETSDRFAVCFSRRGEIRLLSGFHLSGITYFSVFFSHVRKFGLLSSILSTSLKTKIFDISSAIISAKRLLGFSVFAHLENVVSGLFLGDYR